MESWFSGKRSREGRIGKSCKTSWAVFLLIGVVCISLDVDALLSTNALLTCLLRVCAHVCEYVQIFLCV